MPGLMTVAHVHNQKWSKMLGYINMAKSLDLEMQVMVKQEDHHGPISLT